MIYSDNIYFAKAALKIGSDELENSLIRLGFNEELPFEIKMAESQYSNTEGIETEIQLADSGYGQGQILVNPLHMACIYSAFCNEGNVIKPYLVDVYKRQDNGERYTIKQMEKSRKSLMTRLEKLNYTSRKDNVVTFEQLGVDRLFVDESHNYKNLFLYTKMRNVAGIAQTEAQKSSDMFAKCQYLDELTGGKGITFATGTRCV